MAGAGCDVGNTARLFAAVHHSCSPVCFSKVLFLSRSFVKEPPRSLQAGREEGRDCVALGVSDH